MERLVKNLIFDMLEMHQKAITTNEDDLKLREAFITFRKKLIRLSEKNTEIGGFYREIRETEARLLSILQRLGENCVSLKKRIAEKMLVLVRIEKELIQMRLDHPESFPVVGNGKTFASNLKWLGNKCDLIELVIGFAATKIVTTTDGQPITQIMLIETFEKMFNITLNRPHDLKAEIYRRKKQSTPFLDKLKTNIARQIDEYYSK